MAVHGRDAVRTGRVVDSITAKGGIAIAVLGDLTDNNTAASLVCEVNERLGGLDILFNNAGGGLVGNISGKKLPSTLGKQRSTVRY